MEIGDRIKKCREILDISQTELAEKAGISKQTLYKYENNIITNIPSDKIEKLASLLKTTPAYLMGWESPNDMGLLIKELRTASGLSQTKLAEKTGIAPQIINLIENGCKKIDTDLFMSFFAVFDVSERDVAKIARDLVTGALGNNLSALRPTLKLLLSSYIYEYETQNKTDAMSEMIKKMDMLNNTGRTKALEQVDLLTKIPDYRNDGDISELNAAQARTDKASTPEDQKHDDAIMDDDKEWE